MTLITDDNIKLINPENLALIDEFILMSDLHLSTATLKVYQSNLNIFFDWVRKNCGNKHYKDITMYDIKMFQRDMVKNGLSGQRINHLKSSLSSLSDYIIETYGMEKEWAGFDNVPAKVSALPTQRVKKKVILEEEEVKHILDTLVEEGKYQHACCIALFAFSGMRISEIVQADMYWFVGDHVQVLKDGYYMTPPIRTKGRGKEGKVINKYVIKELFDPYLNKWLEERKKLKPKTTSLFVREIDGELLGAAETTIRSWFNTIETITGVNIHPHSLRHFTATWLRRNNVPIEAIKVILGHEDTKTTEIYIDIDETENLAGSLDFLK